MIKGTPLQAIVKTQAALKERTTALEIGLFNEDGTPFVQGNADLTGAAPAAFQADTVAADLAALKVDFNALLDKLQTAGLMEAS